MINYRRLSNRLPNKSLQLVAMSCFSVAITLTGCTTLQSQGPSDGVGYGVPATDRTLAQRLLDKGIENTALTNINAIDPSLYKQSRISVDSFYSTVLLTGEVPNETLKQQIETIVKSMPDVKQVHNRLNVGAQKGTSYTVHDSYITSKIMAKILANNAIHTSQIKVVTDDGMVYVLGKLTPTQRGHLINIAESTAGIRELVLLTDLIDNKGAIIDESSVSQELGLEPPDINAVGSNGNIATVVTQPTQSIKPATQATPQNVPQTSPQAATPQSTSQPAPSSAPSAYIEMYKNQVPGWQ